MGVLEVVIMSSTSQYKILEDSRNNNLIYLECLCIFVVLCFINNAVTYDEISRFVEINLIPFLIID